MCREISFCMIYPNLHQTKINVCCTFNFHLISVSWRRCQDHVNHHHGHSFWKQGIVFGSKVIFVHITKVSSIIDAPEMFLRLTASPVALLAQESFKFLSTVCLCCGQDWCRMKMLTHGCLFQVCSFWSAWFSSSLLHFPCSSLPAQQGHCASAGLIQQYLSHTTAQNWSLQTQGWCFLLPLLSLVADCCHTQRMSKAKFHS